MSGGAVVLRQADHWCGLNPSQSFHRQTRVPDLCHVADLVSIKIHHVHVIRFHTLARWWARSTFAGVRAGEDAVSTDTLTLFVGGKRLQLVSSIWNEGQHSLHPVCVLLQRAYVCKRFGLRGESSAGVAVGLASVPSFARFTSLEEFRGGFRNRCHGSISSQ